MAQSPKALFSKQGKQPMSTGAKVAIVGGGIVVLLCIIALIAGTLLGTPTLNFLRSNGLNVDEKTGTVEVTTQDGQSTFSSKAELPSNYPSDIPVYQGADVVYSVVNEGEGSNVTWRTGDSLPQVSAFYESQLASQGWIKAEGQTSYFNSGIGFAEKTSRNLALILTSEDKDGKTSTIIVVTEKLGQ